MTNSARVKALLSGFNFESAKVKNVVYCTSQTGRVLHVMLGGQWLTLWEIHGLIRSRLGTLDSEAAISARLRELRNCYGLTIVSRVRKPSPAHEYALLCADAGKQGVAV